MSEYPAQHPTPPYPSAPPIAGKAEGEKHAKHALIFGIISLVAVGIVMGPLAIIEAKKAESFGADAEVGRILGWAGTIIAVLSLLVGLASFAFIIFASAITY